MAQKRPSKVDDLADIFADEEPSDLAIISEAIMGKRGTEPKYDVPCPKCERLQRSQYRIMGNSVRCTLCGVDIHPSYFDPIEERRVIVLIAREGMDTEDLLEITGAQGIEWVLDRLREAGYVQ